MPTTTTTPTTTPAIAAHYVAPGALTRHVLNPLVAWGTRRGLRLWGARTLEVRGRRTGVARRTPVNLLELDGATYLVAPRGTTEWVGNLRAAKGACALRAGRRTGTFVATELADDDKPVVLRAYLARWGWETGRFFGVGAGATDTELRDAAWRHPVFRLVPAEA